MPEISRFYGIIITMNYNEHNPPHFHARYGDEEVTINIQSGIVEGKMSKRALKMVFVILKYGNEYHPVDEHPP